MPRKKMKVNSDRITQLVGNSVGAAGINFAAKKIAPSVNLNIKLTGAALLGLGFSMMSKNKMLTALSDGVVAGSVAGIIGNLITPSTENVSGPLQDFYGSKYGLDVVSERSMGAPSDDAFSVAAPQDEASAINGMWEGASNPRMDEIDAINGVFSEYDFINSPDAVGSEFIFDEYAG